MALKTEDFEKRLLLAINGKTKPVGSLGRIETLAAQIARIQGTLKPKIESCSLSIFAGDHGIAAAGVSAFPQAVTRQMVLNFLEGGAAANVFAQVVGANIRVVDSGIAGAPIDHPQLIGRRMAAGTKNSIETPAMTADELDRAVKAGHALGAETEAHVACFGEMGIGNTSAAALVAAKVMGRPIVDLAGRGTGLDDAGFDRKSALLKRAADRSPQRLDASTALMEYGGFEIAMMTGAMIGAAEARRVVVVDGFIASAAALCAQELSPSVEKCFVFAHRSAESGHRKILEVFGVYPLLDLDMRLGEGTGALLAFPLIKAAAAMLSDMASFESANVSGAVATDMDQ
ncbi:MAG: nicotinate-nucleotide--dimethylbenzimidazole phosphoribosyltransferase [Pseudomonadota bacterium]